MIADPRRQKQLQQFIQKLGLPTTAPIKWDLLDLALIDPTASAELNYDRLEFVGDAVVKLAAAEYLYAAYPGSSEGELSAVRSILVSDRMLAQIADAYSIDRYLVMSYSALSDKVGMETRLAAALEATLAALFLSTHNLSLVHPWLDDHFHKLAEEIRSDPALQNYKGALQGWTQMHYQSLPQYQVQEVGQAYGDAERFAAEVWFQGKCLGRGRGQSKKAAEQAAAQEAFLSLQQTENSQNAADRAS
ncbi:MAG TPA: ribonuclease III domain-containing protein [Trichocoleus sp.]|jgi:ribonuclease-3